MEAGVIILTAFISPFQEDRNKVRSMVQQGEFIEIYCQCPIEICEQRDVKGIYKKARSGEITQFTGISSPYEAPDNAELSLDTSTQTLDACIKQVITSLYKGVQPILSRDNKQK
jgi:adenylylsulfate kinase